MNLLREIAKGDDPEEVVAIAPEDKAGDIVGPTTPEAGWSIGSLASHGVILACDGFQLKLDIDELNKFWDIAESGIPGEVHDENGKVVLVEPTDDSIVLTRVSDKVYPSGVVLDLDTLKDLGVEVDSQNDEIAEPDEDTIESKVSEGVKTAWRRSGKKIKKGFRVTSGHRKGRIVTTAAGAFKPRAKASTRMKLRIAGRRKKIIRVMKSKRTRKKSLSKRLARLNSR